MMLENSNSHQIDASHIKLRSRLGFGYIIASLFFLFNPDINVIDVFPDIFGYVLMCIGLSQLTLVNDYVAEAYARFKKMIPVSAGKLASIIFIFEICGTIKE